MKKTIKILLVMILLQNLAGCFSKVEGSVEDIVKQAMKDSVNQEIAPFTNIDKDYYRFYLPKDVGRKSSDVSSNVLVYRDNSFVMCVNVPNVIKDHYYYDSTTGENSGAQVFNEDIEIQRFNGTYVDYADIVVDYQILVITVDQDLYYLQLSNRYLSFGAVVFKSGLGPLLSKMLAIAKTVRINYELIANDFSNREIAGNSATDALELFREKKPSSGLLIDIISPKENFWEDENPDVGDISDEDDE